MAINSVRRMSGRTAGKVFGQTARALGRGCVIDRSEIMKLREAAQVLEISEQSQRDLIRGIGEGDALEMLRESGSRLQIHQVCEEIIPQGHIITLKAGTYEKLGGEGENNPVHTITLDQDCHLVVLTRNLIRPFEEDRRIAPILAEWEIGRPMSQGIELDQNELRQNEKGVLNGLAFKEALKIRRVINQALVSGDVHLRIPRERIVDVLVERYRDECKKFGLIWVPTSSKYNKDGVIVDEPGAKLLLAGIHESDEFVFRIAQVPKLRTPYAVDMAIGTNTTTVYEIAPSIEEENI